MLFVITPGGYVTDIETDSAKLNMIVSDTALAEAEKAGFEYRRQGEEEWTKTEEVSAMTNLISREVEGLAPAADYEYQCFCSAWGRCLLCSVLERLFP